ncbi:MAG: cytochrome c [Sandaracinaceae bacterium]|nr:cytochrome c [Sandaracinaceae bacterium]
MLARVVTVALSLIALAACDPQRPLRPDAAALAPTGSVCPPGSPLTYETFGRSFFDAYCQSCHASAVTGADRQGAPSSHTYDDGEMIRAAAEEIDRLAAAGPDAVNTDMPRAFPVPTEDERRQLGEWLACGAP